MIADLHCHTKLSDGTLGIDDLLVLASKSNVGAISITDHDTTAGIIRGRNIAMRLNIEYIPGIELTCTDKKRSSKAHLLCYLPENIDRLEAICHKNSEARKKAARVMTSRICERFPITPQFVVKCAEGSTNIFKQHIMKALVECGYSNEMYGDLYKELFTASGKDPVFVKIVYASPEETLQTIHEAGGIAVLAHPGLYDNLDLMIELTKLGLDGVEVWHPCHSKEMVDRLYTFCLTNHLLMTGGSDFHGSFNVTQANIGQINTPEAQFEELKSYKQRKKRARNK